MSSQSSGIQRVDMAKYLPTGAYAFLCTMIDSTILIVPGDREDMLSCLDKLESAKAVPGTLISEAQQTYRVPIKSIIDEAVRKTKILSQYDPGYYDWTMTATFQQFKTIKTREDL